MKRREFLSLTAAGVATGLLSPFTFAQTNKQSRFKAIAFDAFPIFDPRPILAMAEELFPGKGREFNDLWHGRQFEYTWLRTLSGRYKDFKSVTADALNFAVNSLKLELNDAGREQLLHAYLTLKAWPDVRPALEKLKTEGVRFGFLSNFTREMLESNIRSSGLDGFFESLLSTDQVKAFKPDPRAYQMGIDSFQLRREEIVFAAFAGWDACGAKAFGYPTFWVNRQNAAVEELDAAPDASGNLDELADFVLNTHG